MPREFRDVNAAGMKVVSLAQRREDENWRLYADTFGDDEPADLKYMGRRPTTRAVQQGHITSVVHHALIREDELREKWAADREKQRSARAKYGFR